MEYGLPAYEDGSLSPRRFLGSMSSQLMGLEASVSALLQTERLLSPLEQKGSYLNQAPQSSSPIDVDWDSTSNGYSTDDGESTLGL